MPVYPGMISKGSGSDMELFHSKVKTFQNGEVLDRFKEFSHSSLDFIVLVTGALSESPQEIKNILEECARVLKSDGLLFVQGPPYFLAEYGVLLDKYLKFKYWIALESSIQKITHGLPSAHKGLLLFVKGEKFNIGKVRLPHQMCKACQHTLRDWGGKSHLMHPDGYVISDVWKTLSNENKPNNISNEFLTLIERLVLSCKSDKKVDIKGIMAPLEGIRVQPVGNICESQDTIYQPLLSNLFVPPVTEAEDNNNSYNHNDLADNKIILGDAIEVLKTIPSNSIDLVFADPPYNLDKSYTRYNDELEISEYIQWCNSWLDEYIRILKPTGSLFVLNLPHWAMYHAAYLNKKLYFQNWIVWEAMSEPRGKLMPAHYALLFYTKQPVGFTFNYEKIKTLDARHYCLRSACVKKRKLLSDRDQELMTDIWWNVNRIKHKKDRDYHPCQLPSSLMERIIRLTTNPGDIIVDALAGTGTTAISARQLGRKYIAIDLDPNYIEIMKEKLQQLETHGYLVRAATVKPKNGISKKELQLELRRLAIDLGRLPTEDDVRRFSKVDLEMYKSVFPTWGKALKAAKLEGVNGY